MFNLVVFMFISLLLLFIGFTFEIGRMIAKMIIGGE
jgi:hypothetical protein